MKLKNKQTGEIVDLSEGFIMDRYNGSKIQIKPVAISNDEGYVYSSLAKLNEEWEDYEESKGYWYINEFGTPTEITTTRENIYDKQRKNFGNYFETKEEAEKAVEKLRAWKRLKDKGFRFVLSATTMDRIDIIRECFYSIEQAAEAKDDIVLLFGGEE